MVIETPFGFVNTDNIRLQGIGGKGSKLKPIEGLQTKLINHKE